MLRCGYAVILTSNLIFFGLLSACSDGGAATQDLGSGHDRAALTDGGPSSDGSPGGCLPASGQGGTVTLAGAPEAKVLDERAASAQNSLDHERNAQLFPAETGVLRRAPNGNVGVLLRTFSGSAASLSYVSVKPVEPPVQVEASASAGLADASLLFDASSAPLVVRGTSAGYAEYSGTPFSKKEILADVAAVLGSKPSSLTHHSAVPGLDGKLHLFAHATVAVGTRLLHGFRAAAAGSNWTFESLPFPEASEVHGYQVDATSSIHAVYRNTSYPCDPCNVDLYYGTLASGAGKTWSKETVQTGKWGAPNDELVDSASLTLDPKGSPVIAAHFVRRVVTGSYVSTELRVYGRSGGSFCSETVATNTDGYAGKDGTSFTGARPHVAIDSQARLHVVFNDQSVWHDAQGQQNERRGQLRYAVRTGKSWSLFTLLKQAGQTESPKPLYHLDAVQLVTAEDGSWLVAVGVAGAWDTDSIYNTSGVSSTYKATAVLANLSLP